jgi:hypothetical protein
VLLELGHEGDGVTTESRSDEKGDDENVENDTSSVGKDKNDEEVNGDSPIIICHKPGTKEESTTIISKSALPGHLGHGDTIGECRGSTSQGNDDDGYSKGGGKGGGKGG